MGKDKSILIHIALTVFIIILSIVNLIKIFSYQDVTIFGYASYIFNIAAMIIIIIEWICISTNKDKK